VNAPFVLAFVGMLISQYMWMSAFWPLMEYTLSDILSCMTILVWLVPIGIFLLLAANDFTLPSTHSDAVHESKKMTMVGTVITWASRGISKTSKQKAH